MVAWRFADFFPDRIIAIASVCTPYMPPAQPSTPYLDIEELVHTKMPNFGYQIVSSSSFVALSVLAVLAVLTKLVS